MGSRQQLARAALKSSVAVAVVAGIGVAVVVFGVDAEISDSRADIADFWTGADASKGFRRALEEVGHGDPRRYTLNGNDIFVSTATFGASPRRTMRRYQRVFVRHGLNEEVYTDPRRVVGFDRTRDSLTGGLVPAAVTDQRVTMRGATVGDPEASWRELMRKDFSGSGMGMAELIDGFRWVEIRRPEGRGRAQAVAIWSGEDFDYERMFPESLESREHLLPDAVPPCPDCTLVNQFGDPESPEHEGAYLWTSDRTVQTLASYYRKRCEGRGWEIAESTKRLNRLARHVDWDGRTQRRVTCRRGDAQLDVHLFRPAGRETSIRVEIGARTDAGQGESNGESHDGLLPWTESGRESADEESTERTERP